MTQEKLSTHSKYLSLIWNGLLVGLPKLVRLLASRSMLGMPQEFGSRDRHRHAQLRIHILLARQLLGDIVEQRVVAEPRLVHLGRGNGPDVGQHPLAGPGVQSFPSSGDLAGGGKRGFVVPTVAAEPLRFRALVEIDALGESVLVDRNRQAVLIILVRQPGRRRARFGNGSHLLRRSVESGLMRLAGICCRGMESTRE